MASKALPGMMLELEASEDAAKTWTVFWPIHHKRRL
jgi:hypothetical protein